MTTRLRLDLLAPSLGETYRRADEHERRRAALAACLTAIAHAQLRGDEIDRAVGLLRNEQYDQSDVRRELNSLTEQFDGQYFKLSEDADSTTPESLGVFRKARATAALALALSPDSAQLHEAIYEAIVASDDQSEAIRVAETALIIG